MFNFAALQHIFLKEISYVFVVLVEGQPHINDRLSLLQYHKYRRHGNTIQVK
jgi:hypothetical protein